MRRNRIGSGGVSVRLANTLGHRAKRALPAAILLAAALPCRLDGAPITWIGGNTTWTDATGNGNWTPADEPDTGDEAIFNTANNVTLGSDNSIAALTMSNGIGLSLNNFILTVNGLVQLVDASTDLNVNGTSATLAADDITLNSGGALNLSGGQVSFVDESGAGLIDINVGGEISGYGTIHNADALGALTTVLVNDGTISASRGSLILGGTPPASTLTLSASNANARIDLDGTGGNGVVNVRRNQTLDINITLLDVFSGDINLFHNAALDIAGAWTMGSGATIDVDNGLVSGTPPLNQDIPADVSYIRGGAFTQTGGVITVVDTDGTLQFDAPFSMNGGTLTNNGLVVFNADATIGAAAHFIMANNTTSSITVNAGVTVNFDQPDLNPDGGGGSSNIITVNSGGILDIDMGAGGEEDLDGRINLNGGEIDITTASGGWQLQGNVNVGANTGTSQINGNPVTISSSNITVGASSTLDINAATTWSTNGNLVINAGAVARLDGDSTFSNPGSFTGTGTLRTGGDVNFAVATTINMPGGTVDLDGGDIIGNTVTVNENTTINAGVMASFGNNNFAGTDTLNLIDDFAALSSLTVNLTDPNAEWTLTANGVLNINALGGMLGGGGIQGSDFNMAGVANISGNSIWTARTDISGTVNIGAGDSLNLRGGTLSDLNRLEGGTITGAGLLRALIDEGMAGHGIINTDIDFANNTELRADDGILNVNGPILDVGIIGTADTDGILNVANAWNTNVANIRVELLGGELRGATITNDLNAGINGFGLVSARVINNTRLEGEGGGVLIVQTAGNDNDWDGAANNGTLAANLGNLEVRDNAGFLFQGNVVIGAAQEVFANGFELEFEPASLLGMANNATYRSTNSTNLGGTLIVTGGTAIMQIAGNATFEAGSTNTLNGNLRLNNNLSVVQVGANFAGGGALRNSGGRTLRLNDGVTSAGLGVLVQNDGTLQLGAAGTAGQVQLVDYQQTASGTLDIELGGAGLNNFDRMTVLGTAALDGGIQLGAIGGYDPAYLVSHEVIAALSVSGTFDTVGGLALSPTKYLAVTYDSNSVFVTAAIPGDANLDGTVNVGDLGILATNWQQGGNWMLADFTGDGLINVADLGILATNWQQSIFAAPVEVQGFAEALASVGLSGVNVPEPSAAGLIALAMLSAGASRRRRRACGRPATERNQAQAFADPCLRTHDS